MRWSESAAPIRLPPRRLGPIRQPGVSTAQHTTLAVAPGHPGAKFAPGAVGLSIEAQELATPDLSDRHRSLVALMRGLGPGVLRIAGASLDNSWWTSQDESPPGWATRKADGASVVRPADLTRLHGLLAATGWRAVLGVDLGHFDPARAADEASFAERILGTSLLAFEIGNEPNYYADSLDKLRPASYSVNDYLEELSAYSVAIHSTAPGVQFFGPDLGAESQALQTWLPAIVASKTAPFAAITQHYYPTHYNNSDSECEATPVPTAQELLSTDVRGREDAVLQTIVKAGQIAHRETRITETNSTGSCQSEDGPDTSPVFASALWSLDWVLRAASAGIAGLNFHGYFGICAPDGFNPICASNANAERRGRVIARPEYYGLLAARQLEGGNFVPVDISGQSAQDDLTAYATESADGAITLAVENVSPEVPASILIKAPEYVRASDEPLTAPSLGSTTDVEFGHASVDAVGAIRPKASMLPGANGVFRLVLGRASAAIIRLRR
jgi:hypothetical protein